MNSGNGREEMVVVVVVVVVVGCCIYSMKGEKWKDEMVMVK